MFYKLKEIRKSRLFIGLAAVLLVFKIIGYLGYNISESITDWINLSFWIALVIAYLLKSKEEKKFKGD